nr:Chain B, GLY-THR-ALA-SER-SER-LEU [Homo sapiens]
GTASSL